jgi:hypothetical protein
MPKLKGVITGVAISTALAGGLVGMSVLTTTASAVASAPVLTGDQCRTDHHSRHFHHRGITLRVENRNCNNSVNLNNETEEEEENDD